MDRLIANLVDRHAHTRENAPISLLERLVYREVEVHQLQAELEKRDVPTKELLKDELSEALRSSIENNEAADRPGDLARVREKEMKYVDRYKKKPLVAKLAYRGLSQSGDKKVLSQRLLEALEGERRAFIDKRTEMEVAKQGPKAVEAWKKGLSSLEQEDCSKEQQAMAPHQQNPTGSPQNPCTVTSSAAAKKHSLTEEQRKRMEENRLVALKLKDTHTLTDDQRKRMEENRKRALEIKEKRAKEASRKKMCSPIPTSPKNNVYTTPLNHPKKNAAEPPLERNQAYTPVELFQGPTSSQIVTPCSPFVQEREFDPCVRCGLPNDQNTLCIVWTHRGEIQREPNPTGGGKDQFRYTCCSQLDRNPCFVGRHTCDPRFDSPPWSTRPRGGSLVVQCCCDRPAHLRRTKKDGPNKGRLFFTCNAARKDVGCKFFQWTDEAFDLPPHRPGPAFDGVVESAFPHVNPFGERLGPGAPEEAMGLERRRRRLIAALLVHIICSLTSGERGFTISTIPPKQLIEDTMSAWSKGEFEENLYPLTKAQIEGRFGPIEGLSPLLEDECMTVLTDLIDDGCPLIRSAISFDHTKRVPAMPDLKLVNVSGLETYFGI